MPKILIILLCSFILAFFAAFIACYFLAKITSLPGKKTEVEEDEFNLYGIKYECVAKNIEVKNKSYSAYERPKEDKTRIY